MNKHTFSECLTFLPVPRSRSFCWFSVRQSETTEDDPLFSTAPAWSCHCLQPGNKSVNINRKQFPLHASTTTNSKKFKYNTEGHFLMDGWMDGWIMELDSHLMLSVMLLGADVSMAAVGQRIKKQTYKRIMSVYSWNHDICERRRNEQSGKSSWCTSCLPWIPPLAE